MKKFLPALILSIILIFIIYIFSNFLPAQSQDENMVIRPILQHRTALSSFDLLQGMQDASARYGYELQAAYYSNGDSEYETELIDRSVNEGASCIIIEPTQSNLLKDAINRHSQNGIAFVLIDQENNFSSASVKNVYPDFESPTDSMTDSVSYLPADTPVILLNSTDVYSNTEELCALVQQAFQEKGFNSISVYNLEADNYGTALSDHLKSINGSSPVIVALNDFASELTTGHLKSQPACDVFLFSYSETTNTVSNLKAGTVDGLITNRFILTGYEAVQILTGENKEIKTNMFFVNESNINYTTIQKRIFPIN